jgi:hypothetical protein
MDSTRFDLTISTTDAPNRSASVSSDAPDDVLRLMQLAGAGEASKRYVATVTKNQPNTPPATMNVNSADPDDVMRLLHLAGVATQAAQKACGCTGPCECGTEKACGCPGPCDCNSSDDTVQPEIIVVEQQAEYDYGHRDPIEDELEFDIKDYNFKGRADLPERPTSARFGSNPLKSEMRESIYARLLNDYKSYVIETTPNDVNRDGRSSPLTATTRDEFLKDPFTEEPDTDGSESPLSTIKRQHLHR